ncbi:EAL domain, c-di-GMP-specific phosphodiesterase class I (or its enzymatically inactive variant) [Lachnospiraceae bacterium NE2001]|nr:EAL domain, c-di-GMP-specific phosphodiesterase class I (or its enzymatically inactive variant) [Lachnospiraceae bacterium NE2001]
MIDYSFVLGVALSSFLICLVNIIYTFIQGRTDKTQNKIFLTIYIILAINSVTEICSGLFGTESFLSDSAFMVIKVSKYVYFATHTILCPLFYYYVSNISFASTRLSNRKAIIISIPMLLTELMALTNPLTHFIWRFDSAGYHREFGMTFIYMAALLYYAMAIVVMVNSWSILSKKRRRALIFFVIMVPAGIIIQLVDKALRVEVLTEILGLSGVMMSIENEDERIYSGTRFYNRSALGLDIGGCLMHNRKMSLIMIHINNHDIINRLVDNRENNVIIDMVSGYIMTVVKRYQVYVSDRSTFVLTLYDEESDKADKKADDILKRFDAAWEYKDFSIMLNATVMVADIPTHIKTVSELFYMLDGNEISSEEKRVLRDDDLGFIMRKQSIEEALSRGFNENSYEVYYQPTYNLDGSLHGAEALIRINDKELGRLFPDEFIPVAEQSGLIDDIDEFVLDEVCKFIKTGIPSKYGLSCINVNLSVVHCMRPGFVEDIIGIVDKYGIKKKRINFEITESIAAGDYEIFKNIISRLRKEGFLFSMDDYGTGYSNVNSIFSLDFDVIKIDKSILWGADENELGMTILENTIRMIQQMKRKILVEGVETKEQKEMLEKLKVDYLQGYYFSKPIPKNDFVKLISIDKARKLM